MDEILKARLDAQDKKLDAIFESVEKTRKYLLVAMWVTIIAIVLPLLGLGIIVPTVLNTYMSGF